MKKTKTLLMALALGLAANAHVMGEDNPPAGWVFSFDDGKGNLKYYTEDDFEDAYLFDATGGTGGVITFNEGLGDWENPLVVGGAFKMVGDKFTIDAAGNYIEFSQAMANYDTDFYVTSSTEGGNITTLADAAFRSLTVASGMLTVNSQIGVTDKLTIASEGMVQISPDALMLFTQQIHNDGTLLVYGTIDASNITPAAAQDLLIQFEGIDGTTEGQVNGYLFGDENTRWNIYDKSSAGTVYTDDLLGHQGQLRIGTLEYSIVDAYADVDAGRGGYVQPGSTNYAMWFQNYGEQNIAAIIANRDETLPPPDFLVRNGTESSPTNFTVDVQLYEGSTLAVSRNAYANIVLSVTDDVDTNGAVGTFKVYDGAKVQVTTFEGESARMNNATFIGQGIEVCSSEMIYVTEWGEEYILDYYHDFSPMNLTVENASSVLLDSNVHCSNGYFKGIDIKQGGFERLIGDYTIKGTLTMKEERTFDMTAPWYDTSTEANFARGEVQGDTVLNPVFSEQFIHLNIEEEGSIVLLDGAQFKANTVLDAEGILDETGRNLNTLRSSASSTIIHGGGDDGEVKYNAEVKYTVNGTVVVTGAGSQSTITAKKGAAHYSARNQDFVVKNASISVNDSYVDGYEDKTGEGDTTISNVLIGDSVTNDKQSSHGKVTLDNAENSDFNTLYAREGDIIITNNDSADAQTVHIAANRTVGVENLENATKLNVSDTLLAEGNKDAGYSKIDADLTLGIGAKLDVSAAEGFGGINMLENTVTLSYNSETSRGFVLSSEDYNQLWAMQPGGKYDLFWNVTGFDAAALGFASGEPIPEEWEVDASHYITNLESGCFYLCYSGVDANGGNGGNVGTIYLYSLVPEPTTGSLSLLALAGLCARRRRK